MGTSDHTVASLAADGPPAQSMIGPGAVLALGVVLLMVYINNSFAITNPADYRFFPPFRPNYNRNMNDHLGAENFSVAKSLYAGNGFANPFHDQTGPTAWMPPVLPVVLAAILWANDGNPTGVMQAVLALQAAALVATGGLVLVLARQTCPKISPWVALGAYIVALMAHFTLAFQITHDCWINLLTTTLMVGVMVCGRPLKSAAVAAAWGVFGGFAALVSPILGLVWGVLLVAEGVRGRAASRVLVAAVAAILVVTPWAARNYQVFGRLIPIQSNLAFELYQSQCLEPDGVLRFNRMSIHPYASDNAERGEYRRLGEMDYVDNKLAAWAASVSADPGNFLSKCWNRFLAATLVYVPLSTGTETNLYWGLWLSRLTHPLPFLSALVVLVTVPWCGLRREQSLVLLTYVTFLIPDVLVSYCDRYAFPLLGVKALLVLWAGDRILRLARGSGVTTVLPPRPAPQLSPRGGLKLHYWVAGLLVSGVIWWWFGTDFLRRMVGPKYDPSGGTVLIPDFFQEWYSARLWWDGEFPYKNNATGARHLHLQEGITPLLVEWNAHPPGAVFLALPLGTIDFDSAFKIWNIISLLALIGSTWLVATQLGWRGSGWAVFLVPVATALALSNPFWVQVSQGQLNLVLLPFLVGAWAADRCGRAGLAGGLVGTAVLIKLFPAYLLVYFIITGRRQAFAAGVVTIIAGLGLTSAVLGWDVWPRYFTEIVPHTKEWATIWVNTSLTGWWLKLFDPAMPWQIYQPWPIVQSRRLAMTGAILSAGVLTALLWRQTRPGRPAADPDVGFAAATVVTLLVSPVTWDHYFLLLLLPVMLLWRNLPPGPSRVAWWLAVVALAVAPPALAEIGMHLIGEEGWGESPPWLTATVLSGHTYALLTLFGLLAFVPRRPRGERNPDTG